MKVYPKGGMLVLEDTVDTNERVIEKAEQNKAEVEKWISCHSPLNSPSFQLNHSFLKTRKGRKSRLSIVKEPWATSKDMEELQALHGELLEFISTLATAAPAIDEGAEKRLDTEEQKDQPYKEVETVAIVIPVPLLLLCGSMLAHLLDDVAQKIENENEGDR